MKLISTIHNAIISEENKTVAASIDLNKDAIFSFFNMTPPHNDEFVDVVSHRLTETLFSERSVTEHREWFVSAVRYFISDCGISTIPNLNDKLTDFAQEVIGEILKSKNPRLSEIS
ncbi:hypothetical protein [Vibrio anguillarum]|uniref:Uncharacterized protein n=2 Tax=Vibrio anguillarum TaxID=55601 RepID=A0A7U6FS23_VIBAN|nr:hypothetical protein [Vibrio anguillarum]AZS26267.1 hypothetical protein DYL72_15270 [Vibrio anguillarum]MBF4374548.1 hypothetical protein [Vibrio anguillarum]MBF4438280.1 hypothetical protein [Vibrio anguillarum]